MMKIVVKAIKKQINDQGFQCNTTFINALDERVGLIVEESIKKASASTRKTVKAEDLAVVG